MKNFSIRSMMTVMMASALCLGLFSCKKEKEGLLGNDNRKDVAVTSNVGELGVTKAEIFGFVNLDYVIPYGNYQIGVEISEFEDFDYPLIVTATELDRNRLTVNATNLSGNTKYYYRTFVQLVGGVKYLGDKKHFTTKKFKNITKTEGASDITYTSAKINCAADTLGIDKENKYTIGIAYTDKKEYMHPDSLFLRDADGKYRINNNRRILGFKGVRIPFDSIKNDKYKVFIAGLQPGKTYYYASFTAAGDKLMFGEIKEFTTQALTEAQFSAEEASNILFSSATLKGTTTLSTLFDKDIQIVYSMRISTSKDSLNISPAYTNVYAAKNGSELSATVTGLKNDKTYYYCAVATLESGEKIFSEAKSFTTKSGADFLEPGEARDIEEFSAKVKVVSTLTTLLGSNAKITYYIEYADELERFENSTANIWRAQLQTNGECVSQLTGLSENTTYYYRTRAYIQSTNEEIYGSLGQFKTKAAQISTTGAVDLGLTSNTKWAACNLGASSPEDFGKYYSWAETTDKSIYSPANYTDKNVTEIAGSEYDAAKAALGNQWRMPTKEDFLELMDECEWRESVYNNTLGYIILGKNKKAIFLPKAGYKQSSTLKSGYYYWSGTQNYSNEAYCYRTGFYMSLGALEKYNGLPIRPVQK